MFKKSFSDTQNEQHKEEARHEEQRVVALTAFGALSQKRSEDDTKSVQLSKDKYSREENINTYKKAKRQRVEKHYYDMDFNVSDKFRLIPNEDVDEEIWEITDKRVVRGWDKTEVTITKPDDPDYKTVSLLVERPDE